MNNKSHKVQDNFFTRCRDSAGVRTSLVLSLLMVFLYWLCSEESTKPGLCRTIRFVIDAPRWGSPLTTLENWYDSTFLAPVLVFLLSVLPLGALIFFCFKAAGVQIRPPKLMPPVDRGESVYTVADVPSQVPPPQKRPKVAPAAEERTTDEDLLRLKKLCEKSGDLFRGDLDRGIRVQMLTGPADKRIDTLLPWSANGAAALDVSKQYELLFNLDDDNTACIVGLQNFSEGNDPDWEEGLYPLPLHTPLTLFRQSGSNTAVNRYTITWLGPRDPHKTNRRKEEHAHD